MKTKIRNTITYILLLTFILVLTSCESNGENNNFPYSDMIERPSDIPPLAELDYVKYPEKPANLSVGQGSGLPTIGTATAESEYYTLEQSDGKITVKFFEVGRWDYVFIPISNFNKEYQNIKITATATNIQKITGVALYSEMYENDYPVVSVLNSDVGDVEQYYIMELGKISLLDSAYKILDEKLGNQTVFGICLFIDSNPSQSIVNKKTDVESVFEITNIEFLQDGDSSIKDVYVEPTTSVGYCDPGYTIVKDETTKEYTITKTASAVLWESAMLNVSNFSSEYTTLNLKFTTTNVKSFAIELSFTGGLSEWSSNVLIYQSSLTDGEHEASIDFSSVQPQSMTTWENVAGYYIKNYKINGIKIYLDTINETDINQEESICVINSINFERVEIEGTTISKGWTTMSSNIILGDDILAGGIGTVIYNWYDAWDYLSIPVLNYTTANKLTIEFQVSDELAYIGIGLGSSSFTLGESIIKSCHDEIMYAAEKMGEAEGIVETIEYDDTNKIYKITFDFTNAVDLSKYNDKSINEMPITSLRIYFTDPYGDDLFEGNRTVRFIGVKFE